MLFNTQKMKVEIMRIAKCPKKNQYLLHRDRISMTHLKLGKPK